MAGHDPRIRAAKIATIALVVAACVAAIELCFVIQLHRGLALGAAWLGAAGALVRATRLPYDRRAKIARIVVPLFAIAFLAEARAGHRAPRDGTAAARRGVAFDTRSPWEVARDERAAGVDAVVSMAPIAGEGIDVGGKRVIPLGGISGKKTILCNEGGAFATYTADERGFDNPKGAWTDRVEIGVVGEAFMHGACVPAGASAAGVIREKHPATLNLGMTGNGPLRELGGLVEHLESRRPKTVLWVYYHNDLATLEEEKRSPVLRRYLDGEERQGLDGMQVEIDAALAAIAKERERSAAAWPAALAAIGLSRSSTPTFLQDLVMGEEHSSAGAALRFDKLSGAVGARLARKKVEAPPDLATFGRVLAKAQRLVASWGGVMRFVYLPDLHHLGAVEHPLRRPVLDVVREAGLPLVDVHPAFTKAEGPGALRYHEASHCSEAGNRLIGQTVIDALR